MLHPFLKYYQTHDIFPDMYISCWWEPNGKMIDIVWYGTFCFVRGGQKRTRKRRGKKSTGKGDGRREMEGREVERLLLSSSKSTVNNAGNYHGRQKRRETVFCKRSREGGTRGEGKKERTRVNITARCQANRRCWDTSTKSQCSYMGEKGDRENTGV